MLKLFLDISDLHIYERKKILKALQKLAANETNNIYNVKICEISVWLLLN